MGVKSFITDISNGLKARVTNNNETEENALVVATRPLKVLKSKVLFFSNYTHGIDMNQDLESGGVITNIHNGLDDTYWTASAITGSNRWIFNSSSQAHTGSYSIDGSATINGDEAQFAKGSDQSLDDYTSISGWIYITGWPVTGTKEIQLFGWDEGVGQVGNSINIGDYIDKTIFNTWHKFIIPLENMGLTGLTIDSIRIRTISLGAGAAPSYYLDDIKIQEDELPLEYIIEPRDNTWLYIDQINITMADNITTILSDNSMINLSYNKFLGLSDLNIGILFQSSQNENITRTVVFHNLLDFLQIPNTNILTTGCDGTNSWFSLNQIFGSPILLKSNTKDKVSFVIRDNMSELLRFRIGAACKEEQR